MENIYILFDNNSAHQICITPLFPSVHHDRPVWKFEKQGTYSVRSAYINIIARNQIVEQHKIDGNWNKIWRCKAPPRIKNFLWRVARGCLPTRVRLQVWAVNCTTQCPFCSDHEDNIHTLFYCPKSTQCWQRLGL